MSWLILLIILVVLLASLPAYPYSRRWGYGPSGALGFILVLLLVLFLIGWL